MNGDWKSICAVSCGLADGEWDKHKWWKVLHEAPPLRPHLLSDVREAGLDALQALSSILFTPPRRRPVALSSHACRRLPISGSPAVRLLS